MKLFLLCLCTLSAIVAGQRITTIQLDGVQYFVSRMNPYSPELNYFLSYQYCRSLGLQLASFETKEKVESMSQYLQNAGYSKYDFWTSGNRLGTGMFLWMSTGLPFNATFDYFENSHDAVSSGLLDPIDHNSNTSPQRTARDSSSGLEKGCVMLQAPGLRWAPEDCSAVKDFICEQTRCYYYNYGSIPVSSAQGRPIAASPPAASAVPSTTVASIITTTTPPSTPTPTTATPTTPATTTTAKFVYSTPLPMLKAIATSTAVPVEPMLIEKDANLEDSANEDDDNNNNNDLPAPYGALKHFIESSTPEQHAADNSAPDSTAEDDGSSAATADASAEGASDPDMAEEGGEQHTDDEQHNDSADEDQSMLPQYAHEEEPAEHDDAAAAAADDLTHDTTGDDEPEVPAAVHAIEGPKIEPETPSVAQRLKKITEDIEKYSSPDAEADLGRQSFFSLSDLIKTLRPSDKKVHPQIDSDYSNTMRVLGGGDVAMINGAEGRQLKGVEISTAQQRSYQ